MLFLISYYYSDLKESKLAFLWALFLAVLILIGLWKMVIYEITDNQLKIKTFMGLISTTYNLNSLKKYTIKQQNLISNPLIFSSFFSKSNKYQKPRIIILTFSDQTNATIRENLIRNNQFNIILKEIKKYKKKKLKT